MYTGSISLIIRQKRKYSQGVQRPGKAGDVRELRKNQVKAGEFKKQEKSGKIQGMLLLKLIFSQSEDPNF